LLPLLQQSNDRRIEQKNERTKEGSKKQATVMTDKKGKFFWTNLGKPKDGKVSDGKIEIKTSGQTHVFRRKLEERIAANAPFYFRKVKGDFECTVKVLVPKTKMKTWLDQCGILVQEKRGIYAKVALEYQKPPSHQEDDLKYYVAAYVHDADTMKHESEGKTPYPGQYSAGDKNYNYELLEGGQQLEDALWLRLSRLSGWVEAEYSFNGEDWKQLKAARFSEAEQFSVGLFSSSPGADNIGFKAVFTDFLIDQEYVDYEVDADEDDSEAYEAGESAALSEDA